MPIRINRLLIPLVFLILICLGSQVKTEAKAPANYSYLPLISYNPSGWIGPYGGTITAIAVDPSNSSVIYAGTFGSGVYKSTDGGYIWNVASQGLTNLEVYSLAIDPTQPSTLYAGTYHSQVFKSTDGGNSWTWYGSGMQEQAIVYSLAVDPFTPSNVYASTRGISNNGDQPWNGIVYESIDGGQSWSPSLFDVGGKVLQDWAYSLYINPNNHIQVFAALHKNGPFLLNDSGWHWIPDGATLEGRSIVISSQPEDNTEIYPLYYGVWRYGSVYKSTNYGSTWTNANPGIWEVKVYNIAIDPFDVNTVYLATFSGGIIKTTDGFSTWQYSGLQTDQLYSVVINPTMTNNLFAGTAGDGLYRSMDSSLSWERSDTGINNAMVTSVVHHPTNPNLVYTSVYGAGVYQSKNRGLAWEAMNSGLDDKFVHDLVMDPVNQNLLYALTDTGGLYQNDLTSGQGWLPFGQGLGINQTPIPAFSANHPFATLDMKENFANPQDNLPVVQATNDILLTMVYALSNPSIAYMGTSGSGVYRSTDGAAHWASANLSGHDVYDLAIDRSDPDLIYAATNITDTLEISVDGGNSWKEAYLSKGGNPPVFFYSVEASPSENGVLYAGTNIGIYRYQGNGFTSLGLLNQSITAISLDPMRPGIIYAGTSSGAYYSTNNGQTWNFVDNQLNGQTIISITVDQTDPHLVYFSTKTHGIYLANIR